MIGIGYRRDFGEEFLNDAILKPDFVEVAPENWMKIGGYWKKIFKQIAEKYPVFTHGLSLSIGSPDKLDFEFLKDVKKFLNDHNIKIYSEHLSYSKCDNAHLYDLLPVPFRNDAVEHIAGKTQQVQDYLGQPLVLEIVSYYSPVAAEMTESEFINKVIDKSGAQLLLDVNNVYVNSFNHKYDPKEFIDNLPLDKVAYIHMAGHTKVEPDLIIDTHGEPIIDPVYDLFEYTLKKLDHKVPVLLERDFNIPEFKEMKKEMDNLKKIYQKIYSMKHVA